MTRRSLLPLLLTAVFAFAACEGTGPASGTDDAGSATPPDAASCAAPLCGGECCGPGQVCDAHSQRCVVNCTASCSGKSCGSDGCGGSCGSCSMGTTCDGTKCVACTPDCTGKECGTDGCGGTCGSCTGSATCGGGGTPFKCGVPCVATSCAAEGKNCGNINDGCGGMLDCGTCTNAGETCGANGKANVCGAGACTAESDSAFCARLGKSCGQVTASDNCGNSRTVASCGTCSGGQTCGGGGTANVCGTGSCTAETDLAFCQRLSKNCGQVSGADNCGKARTVASCGNCSGSETCGGGGVTNVCGSGACTAETDSAFCTRLGKNCGQVSGTDNCGKARTVASCGSCGSGQTCGAVTANVCGTTTAGGCGLSMSCPSGYSCASGVCSGGMPTGLVLDVKTVTFAGTITLNGKAPTKTCNTASPATVILEEASRGYTLQLAATCDTAFSFSGQIYPGTYKVSVIGTSYSNLPQGTPFVVDAAMGLTTSKTGVVLDVKTVTFSGTVTLNGAAPSKTCNTASPATVLLNETTKGYALSIAVNCDATFTFSGEVYPGTYKVSVVGTSYSNLPQTTPYVVNGGFALTTSKTGVVLDVKTVTFSGTITLNGAPPTKTCNTASPATVLLTETTYGYPLVISANCDATFTYSGQVYPGTYKVAVVGTSYSNLPQGTAYVVSPGLQLTTSKTGVNLDVKTVTAGGKVTLNGSAPMKTCNTASPATVLLTENTYGYALSIAVNCDATFTFSGQVYPGTYKVSVEGTSYSNLPQGSPFVVNPALSLTASNTSLVLDVKTVTLSGKITLNGGAPTKTCNTASPATVVLHENTYGYALTIPVTCDPAFPFSAEVYPGTYKVSVEGTSYSNLPQGSPYVISSALALTTSKTGLAFDVRTVKVSGSITLNGAMAMKTCNTASPATVLFNDAAQGYALSLAATCDAAFSFSGELYPGTYKVSVAGTSYSNLPQGSPYVVYDKLEVK